jgi:hypothetical protein
MSDITCEQFTILIQLYNLKYMCLNYDIYCQQYCIENSNCYCHCADNQIYCVAHHYYAWRLFSVLLTALIVSCCCYGCIMFFKRQSIEQNNQNKQNNQNNQNNQNLPPPYINDKHNYPSYNQQRHEKKYNDITTNPLDRS